MESVSLVAGLSLAVGAAIAVSVVIWFMFPKLINDEAGLRLLNGLRTDNRPVWLVSFVMTATGLVLAWIAGFFLPLFMSRTYADIPIIVALGVFAGATAWLFWIDSVLHRLPNLIVMPIAGFMILAYLVSMILGVTSKQSAFDQLWARGATPALAGLAGAGITVVLFAIVYLCGLALGKETLGLGDVKLAVPVGMVAGTASQWGLIVALIIMNVSALVYFLMHLGKRRNVAFGPHMLIGAWTTALLTPLIL